jgi:hypothetical protein
VYIYEPYWTSLSCVRSLVSRNSSTGLSCGAAWWAMAYQIKHRCCSCRIQISTWIFGMPHKLGYLLIDIAPCFLMSVLQMKNLGELLLSSRFWQLQQQKGFLKFSLDQIGSFDYSFVPQVSLLRPLVLCTTLLSIVICNSSANHHLYADDTQLLLSFSAADFAYNFS